MLAAALLLAGLADAIPLRQSIKVVPNLDASEAVTADDTSGEYNSAVASEPIPAALKNAEDALKQANAAVEQAAAALKNEATGTDSAATNSTSGENAVPTSSNDDASAKSDGTAPAGSNNTAPASSNDAVPANSNDPTPANSDEPAPASSNTSAIAKSNPCKSACTPKIDAKASVMESYKRHRAQAALIGDYGSCHAGNNKGEYTWTVDWGDDESYEHKRNTIGPYQAEHVYAKKGKYTVEATFCHKIEGCDSGCTSFSKKVHVKP